MKAAGVSDEAVKARTGKRWEEWFAILDKAGAKKMNHRAITGWLDHEHSEVDGWWIQMITVAYEQERGLRQKYQKTTGFAASASKTVGAPLGKLYRRFEALVKKEKGAVIRKATPQKSMRITWGDGTSVSVYFCAKGEAKSQVAVQHEKLSASKDVARMKKVWGAVLAEVAGAVKG